MFVLGGGYPDTQPTEILWKEDNITAAAEMLVKKEPFNFLDPNKYHIHDDMVFLNIRENQNDGKVPTCYQYASVLIEEHPKLKIDLVGRSDHDWDDSKNNNST
jgi:hypothetical protein